jgi:hypothetical protein
MNGRLMNGGKVYYSLKNLLNNDLIKIIQQYNLKETKYNIDTSPQFAHNTYKLKWQNNITMIDNDFLLKYCKYHSIKSKFNNNIYWRFEYSYC